VFFAVICVDNVDAASAGLGDLVVSGCGSRRGLRVVTGSVNYAPRC
jgi:hypothetical protein